jgi:hypothetical protein
MNLKTTLIIAFSIFLSLGISAQKSYPKELLKSYKDAELTSLTQEQIELLDYAIDHACYLISVPQGKDISKFQEINLNSESKLIRFTDLGLKIQEVTQYFKVANRPELLVVKSSHILKLEKQNLDK